MIAASDWRPMQRNTLRGFLTLTLQPSGFVLRECSLHENDGKRWVGLPSKPQIDTDGHHRKDAATGKPLYAPVVEIAGKVAREQFQSAALAAVDKLLGRGSVPS
jgi:hypothetical protein